MKRGVDWIARTREDVVAILMERREELDVSLAIIDEIAGMPDRYASKVITLRPKRQLGATALGAILGALGLRIAEVKIEIDPEQSERLRRRWEKRRPHGPRPELPEV